MDINNVLDLKMQVNDAGASTVREYLKALLSQLWREDEGFSGKRPFGNSGWKYEIYHTLVNEGVIMGRLDCDGCIEYLDSDEADKVVIAAINSLS